MAVQRPHGRLEQGIQAMVDYIGVNDIQRIVNALGPAEFIARLAAEIEADYQRWPEFEKSPRLASH